MRALSLEDDLTLSKGWSSSAPTVSHTTPGGRPFPASGNPPISAADIRRVIPERVGTISVIPNTKKLMSYTTLSLETASGVSTVRCPDA
jgi:hypothetical protein